MLSTYARFESASFACILNGNAGRIQGTFIDGRCFFVENGKAKATSLVALSALTGFLRGVCDNSHFLTSAWYGNLAAAGRNPAILGFLVEQTVLSAVCAWGCPLASTGLAPEHGFGSPAPVKMFSGLPVLYPPSEDGNGEGITELLVPQDYACRNIDGLLVRWSLQDKTVTISPMQITIADKHKPSDTLFMEAQWKSLVADLCGWSIVARFIWVKERMDNSRQVVDMKRKEFRGTSANSAIEIHPAYQTITITVRELNGGIGEKLAYARAAAKVPMS